MPDIFQLIATWKKQILLTVLLSLTVAAAIVFILPEKYMASSTAVPANPVTADKSVIFNDNIRELYSSLGSASDLDMITGTGQLDTIYIAVIKKLDLYSFYSKNDRSESGLLKAAHALKTDTKVTKTEFGELQVRVWCTDNQLGPKLANALMNELASIHQSLLNANNKAIQDALDTEIGSLKESIGRYSRSVRPHPDTAVSSLQNSAETAQKQLTLYERARSEFSLMAKKNTPALHIVEYARPGDKPDSPKKVLVLIATAIASFFFALWMAVLLDKRQKATR